MNYTNTQLDIIRTFGSKELSEGCVVSTTWGIGKIYKNDYDHIFFIALQNGQLCVIRSGNNFEILGHIPELFPDVARVAKEKNMGIEVMLHRYSKTGNILSINKGTEYHRIEYNPTLSLLDQEESTLVQLLNLFK